MYKPCIYFQRTEQERKNKFLAWNRDDTSFFAAGACHILAFMFMELHYGENYRIVFIKPKDGYSGHHVYVTDGTWAFDYSGWTLEQELLNETTKAYSEKYTGWSYERIIITEDLETFCRKNNHRPPAYFPYLPWERAYKYIQTFPLSPQKLKIK